MIPRRLESNRIELVAIGASAGGVSALKELVSRLPVNFPTPIVIAQHCACGTKNLLPLVLSEHSKLYVKEAEDGEPLRFGCIYVAPAARHMTIEQHGYVTIREGGKIRYSQPSIDLLFSSVAESYGRHALAILLTGANDDGANGSRKINLFGGIMIAQDRAQYPRMPNAAIATGAVHHELPLHSVVSAMIAFCMVPGAASWMQGIAPARP
jgi:two-component system chemotaxis response regulator CheB